MPVPWTRISALRTYSPVAVLRTRPRMPPVSWFWAGTDGAWADTCRGASRANATPPDGTDFLHWCISVCSMGGERSRCVLRGMRERLCGIAGPAHERQPGPRLPLAGGIARQVVQAIADRLEANVRLLVPA